jgi:hypothetical protein
MLQKNTKIFRHKLVEKIQKDLEEKKVEKVENEDKSLFGKIFG